MATGKFRIAVREEGAFVNAYLVLDEASKEHLLVATVHKALLDAGQSLKPPAFDAFAGFLAGTVKALAESVTGMEVVAMFTQDPPADEVSQSAEGH